MKGKLQFTDVTVDPATGAVRLRALFPNSNDILLPGLYVRATVTEGVDPHGILVPQKAVGHDAKGQPTALVVDAKNIVRLKILKTGNAIDGYWQVLEGLKAGDRLIVEGTGKVQPDMPVIPQMMPATAAAPMAGK
jgi:membrane fusion protein (multidrug efflux system)